MTRSTVRAFAAFAAGGALLGACSRESEAPADNLAANVAAGEVSAPVSDFAVAGADGASLGKLEVNEDANGVTIKLAGTGMPAGVHGVHLHEKGVCEGPKFESAGAHWNPAQRKHGRDNPLGAHLGDLANLEVSASGAATASFVIPGVAMRGGATPLADADGTAIVVHAKADDYKTDPSGASGDRIACAVVAAPE